MERTTFSARPRRAAWLVVAALGIITAGPLPLHGRETPKSYGPASNVDTPVLRIPKRDDSPTIDGKMEAGEWEDSSALSSFWYDFSNLGFHPNFLAPDETQVEVYGAYDNEHLYIAVTSAVYPRGAWLRARGRFPDVLHHPQYGILWDDHIELELRPHDDLSEAFQHGLLRFDVNPTGTLADWYWSPNHGKKARWTSNAKIRSNVTDERWTVEYKIPFEGMRYKGYAQKGEDGEPLVEIPPSAGTVFRTWIARGIGGQGVYFNVFDQHAWNTTKTKLILDPEAPSFQINDLGPIMKDQIDMELTVKNHSDQSKTLLLGFFVENASGTVYSSYDSPKLSDGLLELTPGEKRTIRLKKPFPGISKNGNVLWFDVRAAGNPAKQLFRTRLVRFHSMEGGTKTKKVAQYKPDGSPAGLEIKTVSFRERRLEAIEEMRPEKKPFLFRWNFASYTGGYKNGEKMVVAHSKKLSAVVDTGIRSATEEAKSATEAKVMVVENTPQERVIAKNSGEFHGDFAQVDVEIPKMAEGEEYRLSLLLFDENKAIVGQRKSDPFTYRKEEWENHEIGLSDSLWAPFTAMEVTDDGFSTLKHRFELTEAGLPAQIRIAPDKRDIPLEERGDGEPLSAEQLAEIGHGPPLSEPVHLEAVVDGERHRAEVVEPAKLTKKWKSELVYESELEAGPVRIDMKARYDADGALHCDFDYSSPKPVTVDKLELVWPAGDWVDMVLSGPGGMAGAAVWNLNIPDETGVVWDSSTTNLELFEGKFVPYFWFGSGDRGWTWYADTDEGWMLDEEGSAMRLVRDEEGAITWRVSFVNHPSELDEKRNVAFRVLTQPSKPRPENARRNAWHYFYGNAWASGYMQEPIDLSVEYLKQDWVRASGAPEETPWSEAKTWEDYGPPWYRYGQWRNIGVTPELDQTWEEKATYYFDRHIRVGRRIGWWMDEYWPGMSRSNNIAAGNAYMRPKENVDKGEELPYQSKFTIQNMRRHYKRLARVAKQSNVPQRQHTWTNNAANYLSSVVYGSLLVEDAGAHHRAYELDVVAQYPISLMRYFGKSFTGLVTTAVYDRTAITPGDDPRLDRQILGRALLHDYGVSDRGPHGPIQNRVHGIRLVQELAELGFYEHGKWELLPYWRNGDLVRFGDAAGKSGDVYVTAYRRDRDDGEGIETLLVVMNEKDEPVSLPLHVLRPERVFGGPNTLSAGAASRTAEVPDALGDWWSRVSDRHGETAALRDLETGAVIPAQKTDGTGEAYGPIHVPYHDFRVLYARHVPGNAN